MSDEELLVLIDLSKGIRLIERKKQTLHELIRYLRSLPMDTAEKYLQNLVQTGGLSLFMFGKILKLIQNPTLKYEFVDVK